jgi:hypothetical protein
MFWGKSMSNEPNQDKIKDIRFYIPEAFRFYSVKNEYLTPILFVITLIVLFAFEYIPFPETLNYYKGVFVFIRLIIANMCYLIYLSAYIKDLKGEKYSLREMIVPGWQRLVGLFALSVINVVLFVASITLYFLLPAVLIYLTVIFCPCYVFDKKNSIFESIISSKNVTVGYKMRLLSLIAKFLFPVTVLLLLTLMVAGSSTKVLIFPFVLSFAYSISMFMFHRIIALLYYGFEISPKEEDVL